MATTPEVVKQIQINVWLGANPRVEVLAKETLKGHLCTLDPAAVVYKRAGLAGAPGTTEVVVQLCKKISQALQNGDQTVQIAVDGLRIEPDA